MTLKLFLFLICFWTVNAYGQTHFTKYKPIAYKQVKITFGTELADTTRLSIIETKQVSGMKDIGVVLWEIKDTDSSTVSIYKAGKVLQRLVLPYPIWHLDQVAYLADINNDKRVDIKLFIHGTGNGLAGTLSTKVYLFNMGNKFKMVSFFDFASELEYDLNGDGIYEILSCNHVYKGGHSYWVYNAFNFNGNQLANVSKTSNYPLWTKHLYKTNRVIAKEIAYRDRVKEYRTLPNEIVIK